MYSIQTKECDLLWGKSEGKQHSSIRRTKWGGIPFEHVVTHGLGSTHNSLKYGLCSLSLSPVRSFAHLDFIQEHFLYYDARERGRALKRLGRRRRWQQRGDEFKVWAFRPDQGLG